MSMRRIAGELTPKERKFAKAYVKVGNKTEAARRSYDVKNSRSATSVGQGVYKRPIVREYINQILQRKGLTLEDLGDQLYTSMKHNLDNGKASQAVGADLLKFTFKLHDAIPASKSVNANFNVNQSSSSSANNTELRKLLEDNLESTKALLNDLKKEA